LFGDQTCSQGESTIGGSSVAITPFIESTVHFDSYTYRLRLHEEVTRHGLEHERRISSVRHCQ